jgi:hypothetical protein
MPITPGERLARVLGLAGAWRVQRAAVRARAGRPAHGGGSGAGQLPGQTSAAPANSSDGRQP